jgi:4-amino-4-deoxy-L-arabinose transferase-like glycosyltransferase
LGGAASGAAVLVRPSWLLFLPFASACGWLIAPPRTRHLKLFSAMTAAMIVVLLPWWIRNYQVAGSFVPTTLQVGASLYDGISPTATGASNMEFAPRYVEMLRERDREAPDTSGKTFEERLDRWLHAESVAWARSHPTEVVRLAAVKLMRIWSPWPNDQGFSNLRIAIISAATFLPMVICIAAGVHHTWRRGWSYQLCAVPAVYFTLLHMVFVGSIRYRQPAMLTLIVLAAGAIATWIPASHSNDINSLSNSNLNPDPSIRNGNDRASRT